MIYFYILFPLSSSLDRMVSSAVRFTKKHKKSFTIDDHEVYDDDDDDDEDVSVSDDTSTSLDVDFRSCVLLFVYFVIFSIVFAAFRVSPPICLRNNEGN